MRQRTLPVLYTLTLAAIAGLPASGALAQVFRRAML